MKSGCGQLFLGPDGRFFRRCHTSRYGPVVGHGDDQDKAFDALDMFELEIETDRMTVNFSEDETHPIPLPTIPLPQNPKPAETATAQPKPEPASDENLQGAMEEPATDEEKSPEKDKPKLGWAEKFFRS